MSIVCRLKRAFAATAVVYAAAKPGIQMAEQHPMTRAPRIVKTVPRRVRVNDGMLNHSNEKMGP